MNIKQEKEILRWVYAVAQEEHDKIQHILKWVAESELQWADLFRANKKSGKHMGTSICDDELILEERIIELLAYQYELKRFMKKIRIRIEQWEEEISSIYSKGILVDSNMQKRADDIKYQIHENRQAGIYAWEIARELINLEEDLIKKYQEPWQ